MRTPSHICRFYVTKSEKVLVDGVSNPEIQYHKRSEDEARSRGGGARKDIDTYFIKHPVKVVKGYIAQRLELPPLNATTPVLLVLWQGDLLYRAGPPRV